MKYLIYEFSKTKDSDKLIFNYDDNWKIRNITGTVISRIGKQNVILPSKRVSLAYIFIPKSRPLLLSASPIRVSDKAKTHRTFPQPSINFIKSINATFHTGFNSAE